MLVTAKLSRDSTICLTHYSVYYSHIQVLKIFQIYAKCSSNKTKIMFSLEGHFAENMSNIHVDMTVIKILHFAYGYRNPLKLKL